MSGDRVRAPVAGLVLAGGRGRRMGGRHKAFLELGGQPLIVHVTRRLRPQVAHLAISANEEAARLRRHAQVVLGDAVPGHAGPLAGILAGLEWLRTAHPQLRWLLSVAVDTPFFPQDLGMRLYRAVFDSGAEGAVACSRGRRHPVFALWAVEWAKDLREALQAGERSAGAFLARRQVVDVTFDSATGPDPFFNINRPHDLECAATWWGAT